MSGDIQNSLYKLKRAMKEINYKVKLTSLELLSSNSIAFTLPLLHYLLLNYSRFIARLLHEKRYEITYTVGSDGDVEGFAKNAFRFFYFELNINPTITAKQFISNNGFVERKMLLLVDFIQAVIDKHKEMEKCSGGRVLYSKAKEVSQSDDAYFPPPTQPHHQLKYFDQIHVGGTIR
jgi:hypothetical protein